MAKKQEGLTRDQALRQALLKFNLNAFRSWIRKYNKGLWASFKNVNEKTQMGTMCKCICDRADLLATDAHKKACKWLAENDMKGGLF